MFSCPARAMQRMNWRALLLLGVVIAVSVAAVIAALTAASRSDDAFRRLRDDTRAGDVPHFR